MSTNTSTSTGFLQLLLNEAVSNAPSVLTDVEDLTGLFGNKQTASPVPALFSAANATISSITANLMLVDLQAEAQYEGVIAANPLILSNPTEVPLTVWTQLTQAGSALTAVNALQRTLAAYVLAVNNWYANNQGSTTPSAVPAVPTSLTQYQ